MSFLTVEKLSVAYKKTASPILREVYLNLEKGERVALVGESGSGKSTLARALLGLVPILGGRVLCAGEVILSAEKSQMESSYRRRIQMIFQDPYNSLHPRLTVLKNLLEPLKIHGLYEKKKSEELALGQLERVGLDPEAAGRYPHQFSGGQLQRIGIARALLSEPQLILADEPVSALDVSVQAQILNLLGRLSREDGLGLLFVSHDLAVVRQLCSRVAVMYKGELVEVGSVEQVCFEPKHPYTRKLVEAGGGQGLPPLLENEGGTRC